MDIMKRNSERSLTGNALAFAFDNIFTYGVKSLQLIALALAATALNQLAKGIFALLMIARYGHSHDSISFYPPELVYQYLIRDGAYVDIEPAFLGFFYFFAFAWLYLIFIPIFYKLMLSYYDTGSVQLKPFISLNQIFSFLIVLAMPLALNEIAVKKNIIPKLLATLNMHPSPALIQYGILIIALFLASRFMFAGYYIIDKNLNPLNALQASWNLTKSYGFYKLALALFIILNLQTLIIPLTPFVSGDAIAQLLNRLMPAVLLFNTWIHWLMFGLMTTYAYRQFEK